MWEAAAPVPTLTAPDSFSVNSAIFPRSSAVSSDTLLISLEWASLKRDSTEAWTFSPRETLRWATAVEMALQWASRTPIRTPASPSGVGPAAEAAAAPRGAEPAGGTTKYIMHSMFRTSNAME